MGIGWQTLAIRRAVWADGVGTLQEAVDYVNTLIAAEAEEMAATMKKQELRILDVGCGVGGSLFFLAGAIHAPIQGIGVTISPRQAGIARREARLRGLSAQCTFLARDFTRLSGLPLFHLALAIESFVHFASPAAFFAPAARSLGPEGHLFVVDDFLSGNRHSRAERRTVEAFRRGWLLSSLCTVEQAVHAAEECGLRLVQDRDLSASLSQSSLGARIGGWAARVMEALPVARPYWRSTVGSLALEACRRKGLVEYHVLVFEEHKGVK